MEPMGTLRRCEMLLSLMVLAAFPTTASADTTTTVQTVSGIQVIASGVSVLHRADHGGQRRRQPRSVAAPAALDTPPPGQPQSLSRADRLLRTALSFVGTRYVWGGASPRGFDCSGFTSYVFGRLGIGIGRTADYQFAAGRHVTGDPLPGDLVFFQTYDWGASHVGIYLGDGRFINAIGHDVHVTTFASEYFRSRYLGARRFLPNA